MAGVCFPDVFTHLPAFVWGKMVVPQPAHSWQFKPSSSSSQDSELLLCLVQDLGVFAALGRIFWLGNSKHYHGDSVCLVILPSNNLPSANKEVCNAAKIFVTCICHRPAIMNSKYCIHKSSTSVVSMVFLGAAVLGVVDF